MPSKPRTPREPSVNLRQVERLADLSRLSLEREEAERLRRELSSILDYFNTLDKVDLPESAAAQQSDEDGLRPDEVRPSTPQEILRGVPRKKGRYVRAPRVF